MNHPTGCPRELDSAVDGSIGLHHSRRRFLDRLAWGTSAVAMAPALRGALNAVEPFQRQGPARLLLSLAAYSFRDQLQAGQLNLFQFLDFCAAHGCVGAELTSYYFPKEVDVAFLLRVKAHAFLRGIVISGTAVGNTFTHGPGAKRDEEMRLVKQWVDYAAILGAPHIRVFAGSVPQGLKADEAKRNCIAALEEAGDYAGRKGIWLGVENHGGIVAEAKDLVEMVRATRSPWVGVNLDTGNFHTADPYADLARVAPYAVNVQLKGELRARGGKAERTDLSRVARILRDARYQGFVALEYESREDPFQAVPRWLAEMKTAFGGAGV